MKQLLILLFFLLINNIVKAQNGTSSYGSRDINEINSQLNKLDRELLTLKYYIEKNHKSISKSRGKTRRGYRKDSVELSIRFDNSKRRRETLILKKDSLINNMSKEEIKSVSINPMSELRKTQLNTLRRLREKAIIYCDSVDFNAKSVYSYKITDSLLKEVNKRHLKYRKIIDDCIDSYNGFSKQFKLDEEALKKEKMSRFIDPKEFKCIYE